MGSKIRENMVTQFRRAFKECEREVRADLYVQAARRYNATAMRLHLKGKKLPVGTILKDFNTNELIRVVQVHPRNQYSVRHAIENT